MVFRSTPVRRLISRWLAPQLSKVSIVVRRWAFKTFTPCPPRVGEGGEGNVPLRNPARGRRSGQLRWRSLGWPQVEEFGWPPGHRRVPPAVDGPAFDADGVAAEPDGLVPG